MTFRHAGLAIAIVLAFHVLGVLGLYGFWQPYDAPMHFAGGAAMGILALACWDRFVKQISFTADIVWSKRLFFVFCVLGFVGLVGIGWELFEFTFDAVVLPVVPSWGLAQTSIADVMADLSLDLVGGLTVALLRHKV